MDRRTSCRKRKSSSEKRGADSPWTWRRLMASFMERRRSSRDRAPWRSEPSRVYLLIGHPTDTRPQVWQLELFPQPVDDVIDGQFHHEFDAAWLSGAGALVLAAGLIRTP